MKAALGDNDITPQIMQAIPLANLAILEVLLPFIYRLITSSKDFHLALVSTAFLFAPFIASPGPKRDAADVDAMNYITIVLLKYLQPVEPEQQVQAQVHNGDETDTAESGDSGDETAPSNVPNAPNAPPLPKKVVLPRPPSKQVASKQQRKEANNEIGKMMDELKLKLAQRNIATTNATANTRGANANANARRSRTIIGSTNVLTRSAAAAALATSGSDVSAGSSSPSKPTDTSPNTESPIPSVDEELKKDGVLPVEQKPKDEPAPKKKNSDSLFFS